MGCGGGGGKDRKRRIRRERRRKPGAWDKPPYPRQGSGAQKEEGGLGGARASSPRRGTQAYH